MDSRFKKLHTCLILLIGVLAHHTILGSSSSESMGVLSVSLQEGSWDAPSYSIFSPGVQNTPLFRGPIESSVDNNVSFFRIPDVANPSNFKGPLPSGVLYSIPAKAEAFLDENGSVSLISLLDSGSGYISPPRVFISPPNQENPEASHFRSATALIEWNATTRTITGVSVLEKGRSYHQPPKVTIEGGYYFLKITDPVSTFSGLHLPIITNSDYTLELNNSLDTGSSDGIPLVSEIIQPGQFVEVVKGWTLGSLLGSTIDELKLHPDTNVSRADWVYLLKDLDEQVGDSSDFIPHFHNGVDWRLVHNPSVMTNDQVIAPDESVIIARRLDENATLFFSGIAPSSSSTWALPEYNRSKLVSNPFPTDLKLSDLIGHERITDDNSSTDENPTLWLAHPDQDRADNLQILNSSGWSTYWHDGTNLAITSDARISARKGSGIGGALTHNDFSMSNGNILAISNPVSGNVVVTTSENHDLKSGFRVEISSALGYLTNENKDQIDADGTIVEDGDGLIIESPVNGEWEIINLTSNTFALKDASNHTDFIADGSATWSTGHPGAGYDNNVTLSIIGGGGHGAKAVGVVKNGIIDSISITQGGFLYTRPPKVVVHPGGWQKLGRGNAPINDLTVRAGSGVLLFRKHPHGLRSHIPLRQIND
jgi:hypothetical protein